MDDFNHETPALLKQCVLSTAEGTLRVEAILVGVLKISESRSERGSNIVEDGKSGKDPHEILAEHQLQINCEKNLAAVLKKLDISFRITKR